MESEGQIRSTGGRFKRAAAVACVAAVTGTVVIGAGFVSPAWADTLKHLPVFGNVFKHTTDPGLKLAAEKGMSTQPNLSVTRDGVTISVTDVFYDGTRLALGFERAGISEERVLAVDNISNNNFDEAVKGMLGIPTVTLPGGEEVQYGSFSTGDVYGQPNTLLLEMNGLLNTNPYEDEFNLDVSVPVGQIAEPFVFHIPVKKVTEGVIRLTPGQTASKGSFSFTVKNLDITPATIRLVITSEGKVPVSADQTGEYAPTEVFYELEDEAGNIINPRMMGYSLGRAVTHPILDNLYNPFPQVPKTITVRAYTCTFDKDLNLLKEENGERLKTYYKELETTIVIP